MKKLLALVLVAGLTMTVSVQAQKEKAVTDDQKAVMKEMLGKYDTNKDGKLDKDEKAKMTKEDKKKWAAAFPHKKKKGDDAAPDAPTTPAPATPAAPDAK